jgi:acetyl esterase/lipase
MFRALAVLVAVVLPLGAARPAAAATPTYWTVNAFEAEGMTLPAPTDSVRSREASAGRAVVFERNATATRESLTPTASRIVVRARARRCDGSPRMVVRVDGEKVMSVTVNATSWTGYPAPVDIEPGRHTVKVSYTNDHRGRRCDRDLQVDKVTMQSTEPINSGTRGSRCEPSDGGLVWTAPDDGVSTSALGAAPAYYEVGHPSGAHEGQPAKGVMLTIHGGGWYVVGKAAVAAERRVADTWRARGWKTVNVTYRGCADSLDDVLWFFDAVADRYPTLPVCASGDSAGGHLALMVAVRRPLLDCVVNRGGPTDLAALASGVAYDPTSHRTQSSGPKWAYHLAVAAWGQRKLATMSPAAHASTMGARVLLSNAAADPFIPLSQAEDMERAMRSGNPVASVDRVVLPRGTMPWVHARVSADALDVQQAHEQQLVACRQAGGAAALMSPGCGLERVTV